MILRGLADIEAAGRAAAAQLPPLTQEQADHAAALLAPHQPAPAAARPAAA